MAYSASDTGLHNETQSIIANREKSEFMNGKLLAALCAVLPALLFSAELVPFGKLGQSQPEGTESLREIACGSTVGDPEGNVWFTNAGRLYKLAKGGRSAQKVLDMSGKLMSDGKELFLQRNTIVYRLQRQSDGSVKTIPAIDFKGGFDNTGIADAATKQRFGANVKFFALDSDAKKVYGWDGSGKSLGIILDLSDFRSKGKAVSTGFLPGSGYLLISTMYPDMKVYRFAPDGKPANGGIWPAGGWISNFSLANGELWGCGGNAVRYENTLSSGKPLALGDGADQYANSLARDGNNGYYLATTQGLKHYNPLTPQTSDYRIGGIGKPAALAILDGRVLAISGYQITSLYLDDFPDSPFGNTGNEPWHVGANWSSDACAAVPDGSAFLILDRRHKKLWRFDPTKTKWGDKTRMVDLKRSFINPSDLAFADGTLFFADDGKLNVPNDLKEPIRRVDAFSGKELAVAGNGWIALLKDGKTVWKKPVPADDIAVIGNFIAAAGKELLLLDKKGNTVFRSPNRLATLAVSGKWLVGADHADFSLRRFKLKEGN